MVSTYEWKTYVFSVEGVVGQKAVVHVDGVAMHVPLNSAPISGLLKGMPSIVIIARHGLDPNQRSAP